MNQEASTLDDILTVPGDFPALMERHRGLFPDATYATTPPMLTEKFDWHHGDGCNDHCGWRGRDRDSYRWTPETPVVPT